MNKAKFIKTTDVEIAEKLRKLGCVELNSQDKFFVFVNPMKSNFAIDNSKVSYTDILTF